MIFSIGFLLLRTTRTCGVAAFPYLKFSFDKARAGSIRR